MAQHRYALLSGRRLGVSGEGDPVSARLVVFCHPTPGAAGFDPDPALTGHWGVHVVGVDRPGYGASDPVDEPSLSGFAEDLAEFIGRSEASAAEVNGTDYGRIGVIGWGSGGIVALAFAAAHPLLVDRLAIVGARALSPRLRGKPIRSDVRRLAALGVDEHDPALGMPGLRHRLERMLAESARQGLAGVTADRDAMADPGWLRDLPRVRADTLLLYGADDARTGAADARWFARRMPTARRHVVAGAGPLVIATAWRTVLEHVAPRRAEESGNGPLLP